MVRDPPPAAMSLLGEKAWWLPRRLDRITPDVDIGCAKLARFEEKTDTGQIKVLVDA